MSIWIARNKNNAHGLQIENKNYASKYGMTTAVLVGAANILKIQTVKQRATDERIMGRKI
jgi:hypothetical protein